MSEISIHPAAMLFPMMSEQELSSLADDIAANGLLEPVVLYHGEVLDGRNRLAACEIAGVEPHFAEVDGGIGSPTIYVLSKNLHRRHLTIGQRAAIAAEVVPMLKDEAKKRQGRRSDLETSGSMEPEVFGSATSIAAKELGISDATVKRACQVKKLNPEVFEQIKTGALTPRGAREKVVNPDNKIGDSSIPYEPKTDHQRKLAACQKERMIRALSTITGICRGLEEMDVRKAVSACDEEERNTWIERAKELAFQLRAFSARIQKGF